MSLNEAQQEVLSPCPESQMPKDDKDHYNILLEVALPDEAPVVSHSERVHAPMISEMAAIGAAGA